MTRRRTRNNRTSWVFVEQANEGTRSTQQANKARSNTQVRYKHHSTNKRGYKALFNILAKHTVQQVHQVRVVPLLTLFNHLYASSSPLTPTLSSQRHQRRVLPPHLPHEALALLQLLHAAHLIALLRRPTPHLSSPLLRQQLHVRLQQLVRALLVRQVLQQLRAHVDRRQLRPLREVLP